MWGVNQCHYVAAWLSRPAIESQYTTLSSVVLYSLLEKGGSMELLEPHPPATGPVSTMCAVCFS